MIATLLFWLIVSVSTEKEANELVETLEPYQQEQVMIYNIEHDGKEIWKVRYPEKEKE